jgi:hypothetical protein
MAKSEHELHNFLFSSQLLSNLENVEKAERSKRCACVLRCAEIINNGNCIGTLLYVLHHTIVGKKVLSIIQKEVKGFTYLEINSSFCNFT